ncbi:hypothetical protein EJ02DRAFT_459712 [Clathrospora elynae]|uniref:Uncharacterized protein n=1 Tax=Clathrospora elynae TaxID=706981 RepID=A0A6A5S6E3_9PLEO|nr:hypothetical protein EJ02DRAFT_459712 [Clathrospora elynae]
MAYSRVRPQKRKTQESGDSQVLKKSRATLAVPPPQAYPHDARAQPFTDVHQQPKRRPANPKASNLHYHTPTNTQVTAHRDAIMANAWLREWQTPNTAKGFAPSRPLSLLTQAANINMKTHTRKARATYLGHWDLDHEPVGFAAQRFLLEQKDKEKEKKKLEHLESANSQALQAKSQCIPKYFAGLNLGQREQEKKRGEVKRAAQGAEVIDLTGEEAIEDVKARGYLGAFNAQNYQPFHIIQPWAVPDPPFYPSKPLPQVPRIPSGYNMGCIQPLPQTALVAPRN